MNQIWLNAVRAAGGAFTPFVGAYDAIPDLVHLYEMARRGVASYNGSLVRLRRDSDNAESDFGYDASGDLDTAAITTFLGGANGFIVTLYDQVGSNNPTQATAGSQPAYVASGQNGKPIMRFNGTSHRLVVAFSGALSQPFSTYSAAILDAAAVQNNLYPGVMDGDDMAKRMYFPYQDGGAGTDNWSMFSGSVLESATATTSVFFLWSGLFNGASSGYWQNGASIKTGNAGAQNPDGIAIGSQADGSQLWDGDIAMIAIADPSHDDTERGDMQTAINDYWSAF